jgi:carboxyl-terminal processing protease
LKYIQSWRRGLYEVALTGVWLAWIVPAAWAIPAANTFPVKGKLKQLHEQAVALEKQGQWAKACEVYDEILQQDRSLIGIRKSFQRSFRRLQQVRRHRDPIYRNPTYRREILGLNYSRALHLYEAMLGSLQSYHVEKARAVPSRLFAQGVEEFRHALQDAFLKQSFFRSEYLPQVQDHEIRAFLGRMNKTWVPKTKSIQTIAEASAVLHDLAMAAQKRPSAGGLDLDATVVVLEFACGACTALDEYTFYLTPGQFSSLSASLKGGKFIGVGIELCLKDEKLVITRVMRDSPADEAGLKPGDQVTRIGTKETGQLSPEAAMDLLKGGDGTLVELGIARDGMDLQPVSLKRKKLTPRSVEFGWLWQKESMAATERTEIAYIQIYNFQKTTPQELDNAILALKEGGVKAVILDLRGNAGGSFDAAVDSARRFLSSGMIVATKNNQAKVTKHMVRNGSGIVPLTVPMVVMVDSETASAAEVLAGALKDNGRATLVGQTTFGKGCSQGLLQLAAIKGGTAVGAIRITMAKFLSPNGSAYSGRGISPDIFAERHLDQSGLDDHQLEEAKDEIKRKIKRETERQAPRPMKMPMEMGMY